jgi:3-carboxy-cis,cis-muconate cycloisomerase
MGRDISLVMQTEVGEAFEPSAPGRGGSSTMPHKQNPVGAAVALAAALRVPGLVSTMLAAMVQEHERGLGGWHAEWETLPAICMLAAGALAHMTDVAAGLEVDAPRMKENLARTGGLILAEAVSMALAPALGRAAHGLIERACRRAVDEGLSLRAALAAEPEVTAHLSAADLDRLCDPANYTGQSAQLVARVLASRSGET